MSPSTALRMLSNRKSALMFFSKKPFAPIRIHSVKSSLSSETVSMMTVSCGLILKIWANASRPFMTGISRSSKTTSGLSCSTIFTPARPSEASPTTSKSGWRESKALIPLRNRVWSSIRVILIVMMLFSFVATKSA